MTLDRHPRLDQAVRAAQTFNLRIDWKEACGIDDNKGWCIPIAVYTSAFLQARGIAARPYEAMARFDDPVNNRYAEIVDQEDQPGWDSPNLPGERFIGHLVTGIPTFQAVADFSLPSQTFVTLREHLPDILIATVKPGQIGFRTKLGPGSAYYRLFPRRDGWTKRRWPYEEIRALAKEHAS